MASRKPKEETAEEPTGLASTGNPNDLATGASTPETAPAHQESAPEDLTKVADGAAEKGFLGNGVESKPDYSQANPSVMNKDD